MSTNVQNTNNSKNQNIYLFGFVCINHVRNFKNLVDEKIALLVKRILSSFASALNAISTRNKFFAANKENFTKKKYNKFLEQIDKKDAPSLLNFLNATPRSEIANLVKIYLSSFSKEHSAGDDRIDFLLDQLKIKYNLDYQPFFTRKCGGVTLNPQGIKIIIDFLVEKQKLSNDQLILCDEHSQFANELQKLDWSKPCNKSYIIRNSNEEWKDWEHVAHIHIQIREAGISHIYLTDTLGNNLYSYQGKQISINQALIQILEREALPRSKSVIYYYPNYRQTNYTSCPVFALHDAVRIFRNTKNLDFVRNQRKDTDPAIFAFHTLPSDLMIPHQYQLSKLDDYLHINEKVTSSSKNKARSLRDKMKKYIHSKVHEGRVRNENTYSRKKEIHYLGVILSRLLS